MPPVIASGLHIDGRAGALVDDDVLDAWTRLQRFFDGGEQFDFGAAAVGAVLGDDGDGLRVVDAVHQGVGGESAEDHGMRRADSGAGQHGNGQLRRHAHVDGDAVSLFHPKSLQHVGELLHLAMQLLIGEGADFAGFALPNDGSFIFASSLHVAIEAVVGKIKLAADKPLGPGIIPLQNFVPLFEPVQFLRCLAPKFLGIFHRFAVDALVVFQSS